MNWELFAGEGLRWGVAGEGLRKKGPWTPEEDRVLIHYVRQHGEGRWNSLAKLAGLKRNGKSCRLRWVNYLRPDLKRGQITPQEENMILELHSKWGNRWSKIAQCLPGRTDNEIKNYWRTHFKTNPKNSPNIALEEAIGKQQIQRKNDIRMTMSLVDETCNRASIAPKVSHQMTTEFPQRMEEQSLYTEIFVPAVMNEETVEWDDLWNIENIHGSQQVRKIFQPPLQ